MPANNNDTLKKKRDLRGMLVVKLNPREGNVIISSIDRKERLRSVVPKMQPTDNIFSRERSSIIIVELDAHTSYYG
jgi:hypothetical protein